MRVVVGIAPGTGLGRYRIVRLLGRGGMGCVYEALHCDLGKRVAIKTLLPALAASAESRARFLREGQAAARIRHPHVVDVTDVVAEGTTSYLVMEYLEGEDLGARLARQGALSLSETADILLPVVAAVATAHDCGVIHRDLKPENVFLACSAQGAPCPKVVDFGISKVLGDPGALALTATSTAFGTLHYLPPEQLRGAREADARSDQYALGAVLYECLTGCRAFDGDGIYGVLKNVAEGNYQPARLRRPDLPVALDAAIARALSVDPAERFPSVRSLAAILLDFASPAVRAQWAPVPGPPGELGGGPAAPTPVPPEAAALEDAPRVAPDPRAPFGTLLLVTPGVGDGAVSDRQPVTGDSVLALAPPRSWTARWILIGVVIGAALIALASTHGPRAPAPRAPAPMEIETPRRQDAIRIRTIQNPELASFDVPWRPGVSPSPMAGAVAPPAPPPVRRKRRFHPRPRPVAAHPPLTTSAPIVE